MSQRLPSQVLTQSIQPPFLQSIESYCKTTHLEAASNRIFLTGFGYGLSEKRWPRVGQRKFCTETC